MENSKNGRNNTVGEEAGVLVNVSLSDVAESEDEGSVIVMTGESEDGSRVRFGGDRREMLQLFDAIENSADGVLQVQVESWQVLSTTPSTNRED